MHKTRSIKVIKQLLVASNKIRKLIKKVKRKGKEVKQVKQEATVTNLV